MQRLKLDINPKGEIPVLYVSQYDNGRSFEVELVEGEDAYNVPSGYSVQLNVRKTDSKLVTKAPDNIVDNILTFSTTEQMTACAGENIVSVTLKDADDIAITTLYFLISVQRDVLAGGIDSASEIHNLEEQIAAIVPEVIGDDYYNKTQTDALLANKANMSDLAPLASKAELTQAILDEDTALKNWVSSNFATPGYVNERIFNMLPVGSASGNPCIFNTEIAAALQALTAKIVCGGGGGTPDSPIPIVGHSELNIDIGIDNFLNETTFSQGSIDAATGEELASPYRVRTDFIWLEEGNYLISSPNGFDIVADIYDENKSFKIGESYTSWVSTPRKISILSGGRYARVLFRKTNNSSITPSEISGELLTKIINTDTVAFGQTVYGGVYDKSGRLTITWGTVDLGSLTYTKLTVGSYVVFYATISDKALTTNALCPIYVNSEKPRDQLSDLEFGTYNMGGGRNIVCFRDDSKASMSTDDFKTSVNNVLLAYEISTPIVIDVPSISVFAVKGENNITSDCIGDVNVNYKDTIQHYIDQRLQ